MLPPAERVERQRLDRLILMAMSGPGGEFSLYEDAGNTNGYQRGEYALTAGRVERKGAKCSISVLPVRGSYPGMPRRRSVEVRYPGVLPPSSVKVNGRSLPRIMGEEGAGWWYDGAAVELRVRTAPVSTVARLTVEVEGAADLPGDVADLRGMQSRLRGVMPLFNNLWPKEWSPDLLVRLAQTGTRIAAHPSSAGSEIDSLRARLSRLAGEIQGMGIDAGVKQMALARLAGVVR
jgi:hypothetical protein